jgi:tRNA threonylcarbamoyladenosine biosynthesis protein TsaB
MALILHIESSTEVCSVALALNGKLLDLEENLEGQSHSELLTSFIELILERNKLKATNIDAYAVSKGPGSYTGLRIGVSVAKGLCYASGKPLIGISTLDAMSYYIIQNQEEFGIKLKNNSMVCPLIDARRMEVYQTIYNHQGECIAPISARIIDEYSFNEMLKSNEIFFLGNGATKCKEVLSSPNAKFIEPYKASARFMTLLAENYFNMNKFEDVAYFEPFYLKDFIATTPKNKIL